MEYHQISSAMKEAFKGYAVAIRKREDPPIDGEPFMSIASAVVLSTRTAFDMLQAQKRNLRMERVSVSLITAGVIIAAVSTILFFLKLPILNEEVVSWTIVAGLVGAGVTGLGMALKATWSPQ